MFGIGIDNLSKNEVLEKINGFVDSKTPHFIVTLNSLSIIDALDDKEFFDIINKSDLKIPDGIGIVLSGKILGCTIKERIPGIELISPICELSQKNNLKIFFLGSKEGIALQAGKNLLKSFAKLNIVGTYKGFFDLKEETGLIEKIKQLKPDIVFVGMGQPLQEKWIYNNLVPTGVPVSIGVGGSFDVIAGKLMRAPKIFQAFGLEWFFRLIQEPKRLKKYLKLISFVFLVILEAIKQKSRNIRFPL